MLEKLASNRLISLPFFFSSSLPKHSQSTSNDHPSWAGRNFFSTQFPDGHHPQDIRALTTFKRWWSVLYKNMHFSIHTRLATSSSFSSSPSSPWPDSMLSSPVLLSFCSSSSSKFSKTITDNPVAFKLIERIKRVSISLLVEFSYLIISPPLVTPAASYHAAAYINTAV